MSVPNAIQRRALGAVGVLMLLAFVIRIRSIGATNLWLDEANSWLLTTYSVSDMLANIRHSPSSPLYFLLLKLWTLAFGDSVTALRSFSLVASLLLLPIVYRIGRDTIGRSAALVAVALLAFSPLQLYFAQEARVYMLATLLAALATAGYLAWRADAAPGAGGEQTPRHANRSLAVYAVAAVLSLYTLPLAVLLYAVLALDAVLVIARRRHGVNPSSWRVIGGPWLITQVCIAVACLPLVLLMDASAAASSQAWRGPMGVVGAARNFLEFFIVAVHGLYFYPWDLYPSIVDKWGRPAVLRLVVVFPLLILAMVAALSYPPRGSRRGPARVFYWGLLVPLLIGTVVSIWHEVSLTRYLLYVSPFLSLLLGAGIVAAPRFVGGPALVAMVGASLYGLAQYPTIQSRDSDFRPVAALLADSARRADAVVVQPPEAGVQLAYYLRSKPLSLWSMQADAKLDGALRSSVGQRTWIALDYRSRWYTIPPESLIKAIPGTVVRDAAVGSGDRRVRLIEVADASPSPVAHGLSDTSATCCGAQSAR